MFPISTGKFSADLGKLYITYFKHLSLGSEVFLLPEAYQFSIARVINDDSIFVSNFLHGNSLPRLVRQGERHALTRNSISLVSRRDNDNLLIAIPDFFINCFLILITIPLQVNKILRGAIPFEQQGVI
ncbi:Uncharacterized protein HZ326_7828 [Fusarium oxysporum f. sp. albedinis]|nr:Uncharacterized protein HZ326_7828 [Fusarium oxysporum f. sp. albedinis]